MQVCARATNTLAPNALPVRLVSLASTFPAHAPASGVDVEVVPAVRMPVRTMRFADVVSPLRIAFLGLHVGAVFGRGAKPQMIDSYAGSVVAKVHHKHPVRDGSVVLHPSKAMDKNGFLLTGPRRKVDYAVAANVCASPKVARGVHGCSGVPTVHTTNHNLGRV